MEFNEAGEKDVDHLCHESGIGEVAANIPEWSGSYFLVRDSLIPSTQL